MEAKAREERHAYLIMCHNNFKHLLRLVISLDDEKNDIYIHIDKRADNCPFESIENSVQKSHLFWVKQQRVNWGGASQIYVELNLLKKATQTHHSYYHLLSGMDFPIKSQKYIHKFFKDNKGSEFIQFDNTMVNVEFIDRVRYYYFFQDLIGRNKGKFPALCYYAQEILISLQKKLKIDRTCKYSFDLYKGTNWFSITHEMACYIVGNKRQIKKVCKYSLCADEIFLHTFAMMSPYKNKIVNNSLRYIDWERGNPYVFIVEDYEELSKSDRLFARKFDERISEEVIRKIQESLLNN